MEAEILASAGLLSAGIQTKQFIQFLGRARHVAARVLRGQMGKQKPGQISAQHNPAQLNTKPLSRELREYPCKKVGFESSFFQEKGLTSQQRLHLGR